MALETKLPVDGVIASPTLIFSPLDELIKLRVTRGQVVI
jgi:hypothetical protein